LQNEEFEDTKGVIRIRIWKDTQYNGQKKKNNQWSTKNTLKTKDRATRTPLKTRGDLCRLVHTQLSKRILLSIIPYLHNAIGLFGTSGNIMISPIFLDYRVQLLQKQHLLVVEYEQNKQLAIRTAAHTWLPRLWRYYIFQQLITNNKVLRVVVGGQLREGKILNHEYSWNTDHLPLINQPINLSIYN